MSAAFHVSIVVSIPTCHAGDWGFNSLMQKQHTLWGSLMAQWVKSLPAVQEIQADVSFIPRSGRCPGKGHASPLQYSCLKNPLDREPGGL